MVENLELALSNSNMKLEATKLDTQMKDSLQTCSELYEFKNKGTTSNTRLFNSKSNNNAVINPGFFTVIPHT